jgi:hypothetical protein
MKSAVLELDRFVPLDTFYGSGLSVSFGDAASLAQLAEQLTLNQ